MRCPGCGAVAHDAAAFCQTCGNRLEARDQRPGAGRVLRIGRDPGNDLVVPLHLTTVARLQAEVFVDPHTSTLSIRDCRSANGTFVGGVRVEDWTPVRDGSEVWFGRSYRLDLEAVRELANPRFQAPAARPAAHAVRRLRCPNCGTVKVQGQPCPNEKCKLDTFGGSQ